jgi:hypothetical protein
MQTEIKPLAQIWDTMDPNDRKELCVCANLEHLATGWKWEQISPESKGALIDADNFMLGD